KKIFIYLLNYSYISYEFDFALENIIEEFRICFVQILIGLGLTWFTRYWFLEELIFPLAKPFLTLPFESYFVRTQSTEVFPTYVATSLIACSYFVFPFVSHQIWCFLIPSCYGEHRTKYNRFFHLSGFCFFLFLFLTLSRVVPNVWHFLYFAGATSTNWLMIKLQHTSWFGWVSSLKSSMR
ncbi:putative tatC-like protein ymf16, partial [Bienertia sinuspersici]